MLVSTALFRPKESGMPRVLRCALTLVAILAAAGCGSHSAWQGEVRRVESRDAVVVRKTPLGKTAEVMGQVNTISNGVVGAERASKVRMFDR